MKKFLNKICALATLLATGAAFTACSSDSDITGEEPNNGKNPAALVGKSYDLTLGVGKSEVMTRALELSGNVLDAKWIPSDNIYVYDASWDLYGGKLNPTTTGKTKIPVKGTITMTENTDEPKVGNTINLFFPRTTWSYEGQDGTLATLAKKYDYATGSTEITAMDGTDITGANPDEVVFEDQQAIVCFDFGTLKVKELRIRDSKNEMVKSVDIATKAETKVNQLSGFTFNFSNSGLSKAYIALRGVTSGATLKFKLLLLMERSITKS